MHIEYRDWFGVRTAFVAGKTEPVWYVAALTKKLGNISRAAKRLRWRNHKLIRVALYHAEWNATLMEQERLAAMRAGFPAVRLIDSPHQLSFPKAPTSDKPTLKKRRKYKKTSYSSDWF